MGTRPNRLGPNYFLSLNRYLFLAHKPDVTGVDCYSQRR